jgi:uncharacterized BrkB/YihY/UPF0761 family membrane protein
MEILVIALVGLFLFLYYLPQTIEKWRDYLMSDEGKQTLIRLGVVVIIFSIVLILVYRFTP